MSASYVAWRLVYSAWYVWLDHVDYSTMHFEWFPLCHCAAGISLLGLRMDSV
jgi:hypothetical protein